MQLTTRRAGVMAALLLIAAGTMVSMESAGVDGSGSNQAATGRAGAARSGAGVSTSVAARLGLPADSRLLMVHADDLGLSHGTNLACIETLQAGVVTAGSVMVPCAWFPEIAAWARANPRADLGLHLTYTAEWKAYRWGPRASASSVPGLLDRFGYLHRTVAAVLGAATAAEIEAETRAQIEAALASGLEPTHLDSHMGIVYASREYFTAVLGVAERYGIPLGMYGYTQAQHRLAGEGELYSQAFLEAKRQQGYPLFDAWYSMKGYPPEQSEQRYIEMIRDLEPGLSILVIHPALDTPDLRAFAPGSFRQRVADHEVFTSPAIKMAIADEGVILVGWRDLLPLWHQAGSRSSTNSD